MFSEDEDTVGTMDGLESSLKRSFKRRGQAREGASVRFADGSDTKGNSVGPLPHNIGPSATRGKAPQGSPSDDTPSDLAPMGPGSLGANRSDGFQSVMEWVSNGTSKLLGRAPDPAKDMRPTGGAANTSQSTAKSHSEKDSVATFGVDSFETEDTVRSTANNSPVDPEFFDGSLSEQQGLLPGADSQNRGQGYDSVDGQSFGGIADGSPSRQIDRRVDTWF